MSRLRGGSTSTLTIGFVRGLLSRSDAIDENNTEHGRAWTLGWFFEPRPPVRLGAEFASVSARRLAAAESGFDPNTDGRTLTLEAR